jgi:hypothetical protein
MNRSLALLGAASALAAGGVSALALGAKVEIVVAR